MRKRRDKIKKRHYELRKAEKMKTLKDKSKQKCK